ncbi:hypothetical protein DJFAAGMI_01434 [Comamonas sp. PE63]|uniref:DUF2188 domain-containing protein n=1 Tax=Comamonas brasiliensis TaxID=1812482 RepID=A0ABS5LQC8_9BURK|nr:MULTISPECIES: DUF2188 domain-containing protein [unclassified Comamonas]MBS3018702.1 hypothetical protein [Comamonas sp. PE63]UNV89530.1 DUF2188 domain-containing protein [Comamonas sp. 7D-2evo1]UNV97171.1 DUF2188 domain-containing protein [Comamonas sp. 7D-2]UNV99175.1 DUF2188 domain-containing protein [Comamonas sp. 7D-2evo2]
MAKTHHVVPAKGGGWNVKVGGGERAIKHTPTKQEAVGVARTISRNQGSELLIHNKDGRIAQKDSHGADPRSIKG